MNVALPRMTENSKENAKFLPFKMTTLPPELQQKARDELGETEEKIRFGLQALRSVIEKERLPLPKDDYFLLMFLRGRKFRIKDAQDTLRRFVSLQEDLLVPSMDFSVIRKILDHNILGISPYRDEEGRAIILIRGGIWTPEFCEPKEARNCLLALIYFALQFPPTSVSGFRVLVDGGIRSANEVFHHLKTAKYFVYAVGKNPGRLQKIDVVNVHSLIRFGINAIHHLIPRKYNERIKLHGAEKDTLMQSFHPSILPAEFGGTLPAISCEDYVDDLKKFLEELKAKIETIHMQNKP